MPIWERTLPRLVGRVPIVGVACDDRNIVVRDTGCLKVANRLFLGPVVAAGWLVSTLAGAAAGGVAGSVVGALTQAGVSKGRCGLKWPRPLLRP